MLKKCSLLICVALSACTSQPKPSETDLQNFYDTQLLFDMQTEVKRCPCEIKGEIPSWLLGTLLRNGPAKFQVGEQRVTSWFDGLSMLHAFEFSSQNVMYSNRFLRSKQYYQMMVEQNLNFSGFAQDPCAKMFKNQISHLVPNEMKDINNAVVSIADYVDKMVALTEVPLPVVFDSKTLETVGVFNYQDDLPKQRIFESAHPQNDLGSKETINYLVRFGEKSSYVVWKMRDHLPKREIVGEISVDLPSYMHSFAVTERYVVLVEFPFVVNPLDLMQKKKPFIENFKWKPERGTVFLVLERSTGQLVAKMKTEPFFAFHHVNAFDKDGKIYIDIITYPNADIMSLVSENTVRKISESSKLKRYTISLDEQLLSDETIFAKPSEMPRVPASRTAREYHYCYAVDYRFPSTQTDLRSLYKIDLTTKSSKSWCEEGCFPGEPIFVPRPNGQEEDDGVVLSVVLDFAHHKSFLLVLDAKDFRELARAETPNAIPVGLHGLWKGEMGN